MLGLTLKLGLVSSSILFAPHHVTTPVAASPAVATPLARDAAPESGGAATPPAPVPTTTTTRPGTGPGVTRTATVCQVTWESTQTDPQTGLTGTYPITFSGDCGEAQALSEQYGVPVSQSAPFSYTTGS